MKPEEASRNGPKCPLGVEPCCFVYKRRRSASARPGFQSRRSALGQVQLPQAAPMIAGLRLPFIGDHGALLHPFKWKRLHHYTQRHPNRLLSIQDRVHQVRREQCEAQQRPEKAALDSLRHRHLADRDVAALIQKPLVRNARANAFTNAGLARVAIAGTPPCTGVTTVLRPGRRQIAIGTRTVMLAATRTRAAGTNCGRSTRRWPSSLLALDPASTGTPEVADRQRALAAMRPSRSWAGHAQLPESGQRTPNLG